MANELKPVMLEHAQRLYRGVAWLTYVETTLKASRTWDIAIGQKIRPVNPDRIRMAQEGVIIQNLPDPNADPIPPVKPLKPTIAELAALVDDVARAARVAESHEEMADYRHESNLFQRNLEILVNNRKEWDAQDAKTSTFLIKTLDSVMIDHVTNEYANSAELMGRIRGVTVAVTEKAIDNYEKDYNIMRHGISYEDHKSFHESLVMYIKRRREHEEMLRVLNRPQREAVKILKLLESVASNLQERATYCRHAELDLEECIAALLEEETLQKDRTASESNELKQLRAKVKEMEERCARFTGAEKAMTASEKTNGAPPSNNVGPSSGQFKKNLSKCTNCQKFGHTADDCHKDIVCTVCGKTGHIESRCFLQQICPICRTKGHIARNCPEIKSSDPGSDRANLHADDENYFMDYTGLCLEIPEPTALISTSEE